MNVTSYKKIVIALAALTAGMALIPGTGFADKREREREVEVKMFAPKSGDHVGIGGRGWFVDLALEFDVPLEETGFNGFQLTGPAVHNNVPPFPGTFSLGKDDRLPGLIVLLSTTSVGARSCQNIANLFNLTGVTDLKPHSTELWDTWLVGAPSFGVNTESTIYVAVAADLNGDRSFNDAPSVIVDSDQNGICNEQDLKALGIASNIRKATFFINP